MGLFPGRTLEELDLIDLNRVLRAREAEQMQAVEARRQLFMQGKLKPMEIEPAEWRLITRMDEWASED